LAKAFLLSGASGIRAGYLREQKAQARITPEFTMPARRLNKQSTCQPHFPNRLPQGLLVVIFDHSGSQGLDEADLTD
jgi:hypothetical protein